MSTALSQSLLMVNGCFINMKRFLPKTRNFNGFHCKRNKTKVEFKSVFLLAEPIIDVLHTWISGVCVCNAKEIV